MPARAEYAARSAELRTRIASHGTLSLGKRTSSNLFRYQPRHRTGSRLDLSAFHHVLGVDAAARLLDVEGLATFESIVDRTLPVGLAPLVTPELKHITVGGACVGIGIESNCFRHGFVHDAMVDADVLLADGRIVHCASEGEHADLFHALPNSYGTLGYVLRARMRLMPALPFVHLRTAAYQEVGAFLDAMRDATERAEADFIEALIYGRDRFLLTLSRYVREVPRVDDIQRRKVFYRLVSEPGDVHLTTRDYLFRYDPDWFWNFPESARWQLVRRYAPAAVRHSAFYRRWLDLQTRLGRKKEDGKEFLIQDWEVPWERAGEMLRFALDEVDLEGKPWMATSIRTPSSPTLYPVRAGSLYFNLGCYCRVRRVDGVAEHHHTRLLDRRCFDLGGIKMLYSSTFVDEEEFWRIYNGDAYRVLKAKYDPDRRLPTLYEKCVRRA
jgi:FAD/FMN-containing dehydrogenase